MGGYVGKLLRIDLSTGKTSEEDITRFPLHQFLGGKGLASHILFNELEARIDPLGPKNKLLFLTGPLNGICPSTKMCIAGKSPLTGTFCDSYVGGHAAPELKYAGYDGVIVEGVAEEPVYIRIEDGETEIKDAENLWGSDAFKTERKLKEENTNACVLCIGPAGEKLVRFAHINT